MKAFASRGAREHPSPEIMPVLSAGKHRNPRKGACFMEFASYLAGERWSDRPSCTHPALAELARAVNDHVGEEVRQQLLPLVPEVIGLNGHRPLVEVWIARECALAALPVVSEGRQRVMALGLLRCESAIAEAEHRTDGELSDRSRAALADVPLAHLWAAAFAHQGGGKRKVFDGISSAAVIDYAVLGISEACIPDPQQRLVQLLRAVIAEARVWLTPAPLQVEPPVLQG